MTTKYGLHFPREFDCRYCHRHISVGVDDLKDRRSVFCCAKCERQYWRETTRHPTHLTNHDPGMYQWAEKVENKRDSVENLVKDVEAFNRLAGRE